MKSEQGSIAVVSIVIMMLLSIMGMALLALSQTEAEIAVNHRDGIAAQYVAEAGIQEAVSRLKTDPDFVSQTEEKAYHAAVKSLGTRPAAGSYTVEIEPDVQGVMQNSRKITAVGRVNEVKRRVIAYITLPMPTDEENSYKMIWKN